MSHDSRRQFLKGSMVTAGWAALSGGAAGVVLAAGDAPPSRRFLEAVAAGERATVERLLAADPGLLHARDEVGRSAFALALLHRHDELAAFLRKRGHQPDLHEAALALDWERFDALASETPGLVNREHPIGGTAMHAAALGGAGTDIWRVYRYAGDPNRNPGDGKGFTALRAALDYPDLAVAELTAASMLGNGAEPGGAQAGGSSALHAAAARGSAAIVELLIRKGADLDARDEAGRTPLELAEHHGRREAVRLLRGHASIPRDHASSREAYDLEGKPYRAPDLGAFAPIQREKLVGAAHFKLDEVREAVGRHAALAHSVATTTERAVEACAHTGQLPIVDFLLEHGAPYSLPTAALRNDLAHARKLLDEDPLRVNERGAHDFALLWYPVIGRGLTEMAELLLDRGAEVERHHWLGTTALHFAAMGGQLEMMELLIERGADVNRVGRKFDPDGETPLQRALAREQTAAAKLLRDRGAKG